MHMYKRLGATLDTQMKRKDIKPKNLNKTTKKRTKKRNILYSTRCNFEDHLFLTNFEFPSLYMLSAIRVN